MNKNADNFQLYLDVIQIAKNQFGKKNWSKAVRTYNQLNDKTYTANRLGCNVKKVYETLEELSTPLISKYYDFLGKNVIAVNSFRNEIDNIKVIENGFDELVFWIELNIKNPKIRDKNYGQLNLKDFFKYIETKED